MVWFVLFASIARPGGQRRFDGTVGCMIILCWQSFLCADFLTSVVWQIESSVFENPSYS